MSDRAEIIETMARGAYAYATGGMGWETATDITKGKMRELAESALTALEASGRAVVPREPTEAMLEAGEEADAMYYEGRTQTAQIYKAMLATHTQEKDA